MLQKIKKALTNPRLLGVYLLSKFAALFPDKLYLKLMFRLKMGYWMDFDNPQTFNEKLQWLKLYNRRPEYTQMVDKYAVKEYVANIIGDEHIIPTLGVWDSVDDIDFDKLPNQFVLKTTHGGGGGGVVICKDKSQFDVEQCKIRLQQSLDSCIYRNLREWPYKDVPRRIIAEQYMVDESGYELKDYKFFCFNGRVDNVMLCLDRSSGDTKFYFFTRDWKFVRVNHIGLMAPQDLIIPKPQNLDKMFDLAAKLCMDIPFIRIDLYNISGRIYFGEFTFYPASGFDDDYPAETDRMFGGQLKL